MLRWFQWLVLNDPPECWHVISQWLIDVFLGLLDLPVLVLNDPPAGVFPFDAAKVRPAFAACSVHKWLHAAYGWGSPHFGQNRR